MDTNKRSIYMIIGAATVSLIVIIAWLLWAFESDPKDIILPIQTNQIIESNTLPSICQDVITTMNCFVTNITWSQDSLQQWYQQLLSERNTITDRTRLENTCSQHYNYLISLQDTGYINIIELCKSM